MSEAAADDINERHAGVAMDRGIDALAVSAMLSSRRAFDLWTIGLTAKGAARLSRWARP